MVLIFSLKIVKPSLLGSFIPFKSEQIREKHIYNYWCRLLCPWDFLGKNIGVGCHFLLQGILLTEGSHPHLLHCRQILYWLISVGGFLIVCPRIMDFSSLSLETFSISFSLEFNFLPASSFAGWQKPTSSSLPCNNEVNFGFRLQLSYFWPYQVSLAFINDLYSCFLNKIIIYLEDESCIFPSISKFISIFHILCIFLL